MLEATMVIKSRPAMEFMGEVAAADFITGAALATAVGLTVGTSINSTEPWLKFRNLEKILYIAKKPIRSGISWNQLNAAGVATFTKTVTIAGKVYQVRSITGGAYSPGDGSEWNTYLYRVHAEDPTGTHWANYNNTDLGIDVAQAGCLVQCGDNSGVNASNNVVRGGGALTGWNTNSKSTGSGTANRGWRPVLELVP